MKFGMIKKVASTIMIVGILVALLTSCSSQNKATFGIDVIDESSVMATATNQASGTAMSTIKATEDEQIIITSDLSTGSINLTISDNDGVQLFSDNLSGKTEHQITPTPKNDTYTITCIAEEATGTILIDTMIPEISNQKPDNTNDNSNLGVSISGGPDTTDEMFAKHEDNATFYVFGFDKKALSASDFEPVDIPDVKDGHFYEVVADVTFLNGGVAGYVNHPEINEIYSVKEVEPDALNLEQLSGKHYYGLSKIGDYADGDILLFEYVKGVWKDGQWIYTYHDSIDLDDGRKALVTDSKKITKEVIQEGINSGVLSCEDYFVMPLKEKKIDSLIF